MRILGGLHQLPRFERLTLRQGYLDTSTLALRIQALEGRFDEPREQSLVHRSNLVEIRLLGVDVWEQPHDLVEGMLKLSHLVQTRGVHADQRGSSKFLLELLAALRGLWVEALQLGLALGGRGEQAWSLAQGLAQSPGESEVSFVYKQDPIRLVVQAEIVLLHLRLL